MASWADKSMSEIVTMFNDQITMELTASHTYQQLWAHLANTRVSLPGFAQFCKSSAAEETEHAQKLIEYVVMRGGSVHLGSIEKPASVCSTEASDALVVLDAIIALEKKVRESIARIVVQCEKTGEHAACDFLITGFLHEQDEALKKLGDMRTELVRVNSTGGLGLYMWDRDLLNKK